MLLPRRKNPFARNVMIFKWLAATRTLMFTSGYLVPMFNDNGLDQSQTMRLQAIFAFVLLGMQLLGGWFADRFGRKLCLCISQPFLAGTLVLCSFSDSYQTFIYVEVLFAVSLGMYEATATAMLHDSLRATGLTGTPLTDAQTDADKRNRRYGFWAVFIGSIVAALWYPHHGADWLLRFDALMVLAGWVLALLLTETKRDKAVVKDRWATTKDLWGLALNQHVRWLALLSALLNTATYTAAWMAVVYYREFGVAAALFGYIYAGRNAFKALLTWRVKLHYRLARTMMVFAVLAGATYGLMALSLLTKAWVVLAVSAVIGHDVIQALMESPLKARLNQHMNSSTRATSNGAVLFVTRFSYMVTGSLVADSLKAYGLTTTFLLLAACFSVLPALVVWRLKRLSILD